MHSCPPPRLACCALLAVASSLSSFPQQNTAPHFPTNEDLRHIKALSAPQLSPDGKQVLFTVTHATADGAANHVWIVSAAAGNTEKARQLTFSPPADKRGEHNAQWAPDSSAIFFLAKRGEHTQLFRLDLRGGEASPYDLKILPPYDASKEKDAINPPLPLAAADKKDDKKTADTKVEPLPIDVSGFSISPDGKYIALWAHDPETPGEKKQKEAKVDASWVNHEKHATRLYISLLKSDGSFDGALKPAALPPDVRSAAWSPTADKLLAFTEAPNEASDLGPAGAAWLVDVAALDKPEKLDAVPATVQGGTWQLDGNSIVFAAATPEDAPPGYDELYALTANPGGSKPRCLTAEFAGQIRTAGLYFTPDGALIAPAAVGTRTTVVRIALDAKKPPATIDLDSAVVSGLNTNRKQTGWVWLADSGGHPMKLCFAQHLGDPCAALPTPDLAPASLRTVAPQLVKWKSGNFTIEGLLYLPPDIGSAKVPLIVDVHGGPFGAWENRSDPFARLPPRPRMGRPAPQPSRLLHLRSQIRRCQQKRPRRRRLSGHHGRRRHRARQIPHRPRARLALIGYSYGGEMAGFVEGKTDRFSAIVSGAPVIDQFSEYGTESGSWYDRWYYGKPWEHQARRVASKPPLRSAHAKTPFMLIQGQSDTTDPARPGRRNVSCPSPGRRPRRTRHLSPRRPRPTRRRHAGPSLARTLARLRRPPAHSPVHRKRLRTRVNQGCHVAKSINIMKLNLPRNAC